MPYYMPNVFVIYIMTTQYLFFSNFIYLIHRKIEEIIKEKKKNIKRVDKNIEFPFKCDSVSTFYLFIIIISSSISSIIIINYYSFF